MKTGTKVDRLTQAKYTQVVLYVNEHKARLAKMHIDAIHKDVCKQFNAWTIPLYTLKKMLKEMGMSPITPRGLGPKAAEHRRDFGKLLKMLSDSTPADFFPPEFKELVAKYNPPKPESNGK